jgi:PPP family 3-phenylpropionic acid transporter
MLYLFFVFLKSGGFMEKLQRKMNIEYALMQSGYWMTYCTVLSFAAVFLQARGYSGTEIGVILAASNLTALVLQPLIADLADRSKKVTVIRVLWALCAITAVFAAVTCLVSVRCMLLSVSYSMAFSLIIVIQPFMTSLTFEAEGWGIHINFGACRAIGSLAYAIMAAAMGRVVEALGTGVIPVTTLIIIIGLMVILALFTARSRSGPADRAPAAAKEESSGIVEFVRGNKRFSVFLLGVALLFAIHSLINNFIILVVQNVGGDSSDMGAICAFMALLEVPVMMLFDRLTRHISCSALLKFSVLMFTAKSLAVFLAPSVPWMYPAFLFQGASFALYTPAAVRYAMLVVDQKDAVKAQAFLTLTASFGSIFSSLLGGIMFDRIGVSSTLLISTAVSAVGSVLAFAAVVPTGRRTE